MSLSKKCLRSDSQNNHSLNERKEDNYRRDSFEDRFCDDLCEEILQYLSLEDKLECVSKQFQRTVFKRQYELYINIKDPEEHKLYLKLKNLRIRRLQNYYYYMTDQSMHSFKALLKKCPNITSILLKGNSNGIYNEILALIIENCNNLSEVLVFH